MSLVTGLIAAQPAPRSPAPSREEEVRQALEKNFAQVTNPPAALSKPVAAITNAAPAKPAATNLAGAPVVPVATTNAPAAEAAAPLVRPFRTATTAADTNAAPVRPTLPAFPVPPAARRAAA